uniref:Uncharacterized protein n=1 Tax=Opuntia streptacantha TaxID=393608 RepID=A0A7C8ZMK7_OPUST
MLNSSMMQHYHRIRKRAKTTLQTNLTIKFNIYNSPQKLKHHKLILHLHFLIAFVSQFNQYSEARIQKFPELTSKIRTGDRGARFRSSPATQSRATAPSSLVLIHSRRNLTSGSDRKKAAKIVSICRLLPITGHGR